MIESTLSSIAAALGGQRIGADTAFQACSTDSRAIAAGCLFIALRGERLDGHDFVETARRQGAAAALVEQASLPRLQAGSLPLLAVEDTRLALGQLAAWWRNRFADLKLAAVTGSNGKTTVKEMIAAICRQDSPTLATQGNFNNEIGLPLTLFKLSASHRRAVLEMGASHPGDIAYLTRLARPQAAVITLCAPAHLEGFGSEEGVARAKAEIFEGLPASGMALINRDDRFYGFWHNTLAGRGLQEQSFGLDTSADWSARELQNLGLSSRFILTSPAGEIALHLPLPGLHNARNALAAAAVAHALGCGLEQIRAGLENTPAAQGRLQQRRGLRDCTILDDSYNANPVSLQAGLDVLRDCPPPRWLALGDMLELGDNAEEFHRQAGLAARVAGVERLLALGTLSRHSVESFGAGAAHYPDHAALAAALREELPADATLLVKGSRGSRMEKIAQAVEEKNPL